MEATEHEKKIRAVEDEIERCRREMSKVQDSQLGIGFFQYFLPSKTKTIDPDALAATVKDLMAKIEELKRKSETAKTNASNAIDQIEKKGENSKYKSFLKEKDTLEKHIRDLNTVYDNIDRYLNKNPLDPVQDQSSQSQNQQTVSTIANAAANIANAAASDPQNAAAIVRAAIKK